MPCGYHPKSMKYWTLAFPCLTFKLTGLRSPDSGIRGRMGAKRVPSEVNMRIPRAAAIMFKLAIVMLFALTLTGAGRTAKEIYGRNAKAAYVDPTLVAFVSPGLNITVNSAKIAGDGTITAVVTL